MILLLDIYFKQKKNWSKAKTTANLFIFKAIFSNTSFIKVIDLDILDFVIIIYSFTDEKFYLLDSD